MNAMLQSETFLAMLRVDFDALSLNVYLLSRLACKDYLQHTLRAVAKFIGGFAIMATCSRYCFAVIFKLVWVNFEFPGKR